MVVWEETAKQGGWLWGGEPGVGWVLKLDRPSTRNAPVRDLATERPVTYSIGGSRYRRRHDPPQTCT